MAYKYDITIDDTYRILETRSKTTLRENDANARAYDALEAARNGENSTQWGRRLFGLLVTDNVPMTLTPHGGGATLEGTPGHNIFNGAEAGRYGLLSGWSNPVNNVTTLVSSIVSVDKLFLGEHTSVASETDPNPKFWTNPTNEEIAIIDDVIATMDSFNSISIAVGSESSNLDAFAL